MRKNIQTSDAPAAIGPYSQAVESGGILFISGQIPLDPGTSEPTGKDIATQTRQVLLNLQAIVKAAGYTLDNIVRTTVYLTDMNDFQEMNEVYASFIKGKPARSTVEVSGLPKKVRIEIDAIAMKLQG